MEISGSPGGGCKCKQKGCTGRCSPRKTCLFLRISRRIAIVVYWLPAPFGVCICSECTYDMRGGSVNLSHRPPCNKFSLVLFQLPPNFPLSSWTTWDTIFQISPNAPPSFVEARIFDGKFKKFQRSENRAFLKIFAKLLSIYSSFFPHNQHHRYLCTCYP